MAAKSYPLPPLFKADSATLAFYASKDGKLTVTYQGWDASKGVLGGTISESSLSFAITVTGPRRGPSPSRVTCTARAQGVSGQIQRRLDQACYRNDVEGGGARHM